MVSEDIKECIVGGEVKIEQKVPSLNASGTKNCDIVAYRNGAIVIFPVKFVMQIISRISVRGKILTGETMHLKWANRMYQLFRST